MKKVLFINSTQPQCGVYQYGKRVHDIVVKSKKYDFVYLECPDIVTYRGAIVGYKPIAVIYNYHPLTMPWFNGEKYAGVRQYQIHHEGTPHNNLHPDAYLFADSVYPETDKIHALPRPLFENLPNYTKPQIPTIGSFGFGFGNKNYGAITKMVNEQFPEAILRLHIPRAYFGDREGQATSQILPGIQNEMTNSGIKLELTHDFMSTDDLLRFLGENTLNLFLYEEMHGRGLSSVIDYALSVDTPLGINTSYMFRHIYSEAIDADKTPLREIIANGSLPIEPYRLRWSHNALIDKVEKIIT